jgi:glycosyltransferase involved in cell wall biosynthesis
MIQRSVLQVVQPSDGGAPQHVRWLSVGLASLGWRVEVAAPPDSSARAPLASAGITVHELPMERAPGPADLAAALQLRSLDRSRRYDVVHAHSSKAGALVRLALARPRRFVYTPHCFAFLAGLGAARNVYRGIEQALVPRTGALIAVSRWEHEQGADTLAGLRRRLHTIVNGVPPCAKADPARELREFADGRPLAGMVAVLRQQKDPINLVAAAAALIEDARLPGRVAIVGNGELNREVREEIERRGVGADVRWFPYRGEVWPYLRALDLFVLPSAWESMPLGLLEAMHCGLPVVATDVGGVPEVVTDGETGLLVPAGEPRALAEALERGLADRDARGDWGARARVVASTHFTADAMVRATADLYLARLGAPSPEPSLQRLDTPREYDDAWVAQR